MKHVNFSSIFSDLLYLHYVILSVVESAIPMLHLAGSAPLTGKTYSNCAFAASQQKYLICETCGFYCEAAVFINKVIINLLN